MGEESPKIEPDPLHEPVHADSILPLVYDELRKLAAAHLANETPNQTLQATALVHEAYIRIVGQNPDQPWNHRGHFFAAAAHAMRRILIDRARDRRRQKRGGGGKREPLDVNSLVQEPLIDDLPILDEMVEKLALEDPDGAKLVRLRIFAGLSLAEAADVMGVSKRTAERYWDFARAWLAEAVSENDSSL